MPLLFFVCSYHFKKIGIVIYYTDLSSNLVFNQQQSNVGIQINSPRRHEEHEEHEAFT